MISREYNYGHSMDLEKLQALYKEARGFHEHILNQKFTWGGYGSNTGSASQWGDKMNGYLNMFIKIFRDVDQQPGISHPIKIIKDWFRNAEFQWRRTGQDGNGTLFSQWLTTGLTTIEKLVEKFKELISQQKNRLEEERVLKLRSERERLLKIELQKQKQKKQMEKQAEIQRIRLRERQRQRERERERSRSRQKFRDRQRDIFSSNKMNQNQNQNPEKKVETVILQSYKTWYKEEMQRKEIQIKKLELENKESNQQLAISSGKVRRLTLDINEEIIRRQSLESYCQQLKKQVDKLKKSRY